MSLYLGLDLGTSSLKALLIDEDQRTLAEAEAPLSVSRPHPGWSEQDPADWIAAAEQALDAVSARVDLASVRAIGLSGQMHGATLLDEADRPLRPCLLWNDTRAAEEAAALDADPRFRAITGNIVFPGFTAPKLAWTRAQAPEVFGKTRKILLPKDFLRLWLTGEHVSDMSDAAGTSWLDVAKRDWSDELLAATHLTRAHMPRLVEGSQPSGTVRRRIAARFGLPPTAIVAGGAGDNAAAALGAGVVRPGDAFLSLGTSGVLFAASDGFHPDPATAVHSFCHALPNAWHQMAVILSAADSLTWLSQLTGRPAAELTAGLGPLRPPGRPLFLPYLGGERTPLNDAAIRAALLGCDHKTDPEAAARAVLEGVAFAFRDGRDALASAGTRPSRYVALGGGARSDAWLAILATVLNTPIDAPASTAAGAALGAARLAKMAVGAPLDVAFPPAAERMFDPDASLIGAFDDAHARFVAARNALGALS
ncbi:MAG: xylulokinase [Pseudomonadota bacterium]